jgi:hypothetical protein
MTINQIIGNRTEKNRVDTELWKKLNEKYSGLENKTEEETTPVENNILQKITYDINGKPEIKLTPIENTVVNTPTLEEYDNLMQIYESGKRIWNLNENKSPTELTIWKKGQLESCIGAGASLKTEPTNSFGCDYTNYFQKKGWNVISFNEYCNKQGIDQDMIQILNKWYDTNKPDRPCKE